MEKLTIIVFDHVDFGIIKAHESGIETKYMFPVHARNIVQSDFDHLNTAT